MPLEIAQPAKRRAKKLSKATSTLEDVARKIGVSPMTVSRALSRPELVSEETLIRVQKAVEEIGYVPNGVASTLASNRSRLVAMMLPTMTNAIFAGYTQALTERLSKAGYQVLLGFTNYSMQVEEDLLATVITRRPDGIVLTGTQHSPRSLKLLQAANIPVVETWDKVDETTGPGLDMVVGFSHFQVGEEVARFLISEGYKHFGLLWLDDIRGGMRLQGVKRELSRQGIDPCCVKIVKAPATQQLGRDGFSEMIDAYPKMDVIICSSDELAFGVLTEARMRGICIPDDLAVIGYGDFAAASSVLPSLTTVRINSAEIGTQAAEALIAGMQHRDAGAAARHIDTGFEIVARDSTSRKK